LKILMECPKLQRRKNNPKGNRLLFVFIFPLL
jgi:hypothetical protein